MLGRTFFGGATGWNGRTSALTGAQTKSIARTGGQLPPAAGLTAPVILDPQDEILLAGVRRDGRVPATDLAAALGCSQPAASRRLDRLVASGALFFDVEIAPEHLGYQVEARLWVTVAPGRRPARAPRLCAIAPLLVGTARSPGAYRPGRLPYRGR